MPSPWPSVPLRSTPGQGLGCSGRFSTFKVSGKTRPPQSAAAIPLRHFDLDLANICDRKSEYWIVPESYSDEDVSKLGIRLGDVRGAYRKLMKPNYSMFKKR